MAEVVVLPPTIAQQVRRTKVAAERLEQCLRPLFLEQPDDISKMTSQQQAELHLVVAQGLVAIQDLFSKVTGDVNTDLEKEKARVERYVGKVKVVSNDLELSKSSRSLTVDVAAANRFIDAVIPGASRKEAAEDQQANKRQKLEEDRLETDKSNRKKAENAQASVAAAKLLSEVLGLNQKAK